jgi:Zn-dependent protease
MYSFFTSLGFELPLALVLMGIFAIRAKVRPRASLFIQATPEAVFNVIDMYDGKVEDWGHFKISSELLNAEKSIFQKTYQTRLTNGIIKTFNALFSINKRVPNKSLEIHRAGLEGKSLNNELLSQTFSVSPEANGCRLAIAYEWGPRPLIAQLVARADLWGGIFRIKGVAEHGKPVEWPYIAISACVSIVTAFLSLIAFALVVGWSLSALLILCLFVHEFGHLLSYRMMGQPWGKVIFLPFVGAVAMPRLPFDSQGQMVFAALMGPGFSLPLALSCYAHGYYTGTVDPLVASLGWITCILNLFNLLPIEPLDGGVALRSVLGRYMGKSARFGLMSIGIIFVSIGIALGQLLLVAFGGIAILLNIRDRKIDQGFQPLTNTQLVLTLLCYANMIAFYVLLLQLLGPAASLLQA